MLNFEEKLAIIESFTELTRSNVSLGRVNFQFEDSLYDRKNVVYHLHPNGNGFVYAGLLRNFSQDDKGMINIRDYSELQLRTLLRQSIDSLSVREEEPAPKPSRNRKKKDQLWTNEENQSLVVKWEDDMWYIYSGINLEMAFETHKEVEAYMEEEGFTRELG
ncbi:hypothetical protein [Paenibacillus glycanilyticus]|uniref:Uncharacterized protein n=1 Tax=Paenibacillus glycanilyticus TaxID=126569 RepID=A0ABQ6G9V2_9BACL|nr:hypothetical protein [Paenibacillus glycanilyticus]GLX67709.1 hypothetical protein MU1_20540 [Paenibacillus glycanilyticus]